MAKIIKIFWYVWCLWQILMASAMANDDFREEGDACFFDGIEGSCTLANDCTIIRDAVADGRLTVSEVASCGVVVLDELICCPKELKSKKRINDSDMKNDIERPSVEACRKIDKGSDRKVEFHIIGGEKVERTDYRHVAAIGFESATPNTYDFVCGGSLIAPRFVLSAAHCESRDGRPPIIVRLGVKDFTKDYEVKDGQDIRIKHIHVHDQYQINRVYHDIAVFKLENDAVYTEYIYPACLYTDPSPPPSDGKYFVTGWGVDKTRKVSKVLRKAQLNLVPLDNCNMSYANSGGDFGFHRSIASGVTKNQICASYNGKDACRGDSGGPLNMVADPDRRFYKVIGIVASGSGCASDSPGIYTRVAAYLDFIEGIVWPKNK